MARAIGFDQPKVSHRTILHNVKTHSSIHHPGPIWGNLWIGDVLQIENIQIRKVLFLGVRYLKCEYSKNGRNGDNHQQLKHGQSLTFIGFCCHLTPHLNETTKIPRSSSPVCPATIRSQARLISGVRIRFHAMQKVPGNFSLEKPRSEKSLVEPEFTYRISANILQQQHSKGTDRPSRH